MLMNREAGVNHLRQGTATVLEEPVRCVTGNRGDAPRLARLRGLECDPGSRSAAGTPYQSPRSRLKAGPRPATFNEGARQDFPRTDAL